MPTIAADGIPNEEQIARNVQALKNRLRGRGGRRVSRGGRIDPGIRDTGNNAASESVLLDLHISQTLKYFHSSEAPSKKKNKAKVQRKWGNEPISESEMASFDFSNDRPPSQSADSGQQLENGSHNVQSLVDKSSLGTRTKDGLYEVKDWEFTSTKGANSMTASNSIMGALSIDKADKASSNGTFGNLFARLTGSKTLTEQDLQPVLEAMKQHLMQKNVAKEIAEKVCEGVGLSLIGQKVGSFQSMHISIFPDVLLPLNPYL